MPVPVVMKGGMPTVSSGSQITTRGIILDHLLGLRRRLGDDAGAANLGARPRRGRHGNHGRDLVGFGARPPIADILEIPERPGLPGHEGNDLAGIEA
jgi:hypothetical protein